MLPAVIPNFALLFVPTELAEEVPTLASIRRQRRLMIRQALNHYGHWLDQETLDRIWTELEIALPSPSRSHMR